MLIRFLGMAGLMVLMAPATVGWFAIGSTMAGFGVAIWLSQRGGIQHLFVEEEKPAVNIGHAQPATALRVWTESAALVLLGILVGYLLGHLLALQAHAHTLAQVTVFA